MGKDRGQKSILGGIYIRMDHPTDRLVERVLCFVPQKGTRSNAWFVSTSLLPTMKHSMKL